MKNYAIKRLIISILMLSSLSAAAQKDQDLIKAVIEKETQSFYRVDRKGWEESWQKTPYAYWSYSDSTGTSYVEGWDQLNKTFDDYFKTAKPNQAKIINEWVEVRVYGNGAYARFTQRVQDDIDRDETSQVRVLEKGKDGKWKVICVAAVAVYSK
mgnify:CR=1 FL=1